MTNRFRLSGTLASRLEESGISSDAVLRRAGLSFGLFKQSKIFLTTEEMFALHRAIHDVSGNPVIGLKLGSDFGCSVKFGARHNRLFFRAEDMAQPFVTHNAELLELLAPQLEIQLSQLAADSLKTQVKTILKKLLAGNRPRLQDVAGELRLSTRTLQRKLLEEGLTFHTLMEEARKEMAKHYLLQSALELNETAYLLGYEDPNSFIRAFHKWEGTSPGEWRSTQPQYATSGM